MATFGGGTDMFVEITDAEQARNLREAGLLWYEDNWLAHGVDPPSSVGPSNISVESQRQLMDVGYRYYVLLEE